MYSHKISKQFSSVQNQPGKCCVNIWFSKTSVSKTLNSWWNDSKAYVKDMSPPYTMSLSRHWLLSGCHHPPVTDAGGMDGCKHDATLERQVVS